jgi:hypothetical protein
LQAVVVVDEGAAVVEALAGIAHQLGLLVVAHQPKARCHYLFRRITRSL